MTKKSNKREEKIKEFSDLLDGLSATEDKKKLLWKESYQNAIEDRESAAILLNEKQDAVSPDDIFKSIGD